MKIVAMVPARGGSKGIIDKNLQMIGDHSLVQRTIRSCMNSRKVDAIVVSSDSIRILESVNEELDFRCASSWKDFLVTNNVLKVSHQAIPVYFHLRDTIDSGDKSLIGKTIKNLNNTFSRILRDDVAILMLQPTTPFRKIQEIDDFLSVCITEGIVHSAVSIRKVEDTHPARMYTLDGYQLKHLGMFEDFQFAPRQALPDVYLRDGAFYLITHDQCNREMPVSKDSRFYIRSYPYTINIDTLSDLILAREEFESRPELREL